MPTSRQVVPDFGTVLQVAGTMEVRLGVTATLNTKEHQRLFKNRVENGRMNVECRRSVLTNYNKVFTGCTRNKATKVSSVKCFYRRVYRVLVTKFIDARNRTKGAIHPDIGLYGIRRNQTERSTPGLFAAIRVDHRKLGVLRVRHIGILVILRPKATLVQANRSTVIDIQRIQITTGMDLVGTVQIRQVCHGKVHGKEHQ